MHTPSLSSRVLPGLVLAALPWLAVGAQESEPGPPASPELPAGLIELFEIVDGFDTFPTGERPLQAERSDRLYPEEKLGYVIEESAEAVTLRYLDLSHERLPRQLEIEADEEGDPPQVLEGWFSIGPPDLDATVEGLLELLAIPRNDRPFQRRYVRLRQMASVEAEAVLLACYLARHGHPALAARIGAGLTDLRDARRELGYWLEGQLAREHARRDIAWEELLGRHERWLEAFPESVVADDVEVRVQGLRRLLAATPPGTTEGEPEDRLALARRLVFELRDAALTVPAERMPDFAGNDAWLDFIAPCLGETGPRTAVTALLDLGMDAVPALVEATGDPTPTRAAYYYQRGGSFGVLTVSEFADELLRAITRLTLSATPETGETSWREWWATAQGDPVRALELLVRQGTPDSLAAAEQLHERGALTTDALIEGVRAATNPWYREALTRFLLEDTSDAAREFLEEELGSGPLFHARCQLARAMLENGDRRGLDVMLVEWERREALDEVERHWLLELLLESGDVEIIVPALQQMASDGIGEWALLVNVLEDLPVRTILARVGEAGAPRVAAALQELAVSMLGERRGALLSSSSFAHRNGWVSMLDARPMDRVALFLSTTWPADFAFDPRQVARLRDQQILSLQNAWRRRQGLPPLQLDEAILQADREIPTDAIARTITAVRLRPGGLASHGVLGDHVRALLGTPLEDASLIGLLELAQEQVGEPGTMLEVICDRLPDGRGITLTLEKLRAPDEGDGTSLRAFVRSGTEVHLHESGGWWRASDEDRRLRFDAAVQAALAADTRAVVEIRLAR
jgi:hypothetical protein